MTLFGNASVWRWLTLLAYFSLFFLLIAKISCLAPPRYFPPATFLIFLTIMGCISSSSAIIFLMLLLLLQMLVLVLAL